jgi:hypothetical protein
MRVLLSPKMLEKIIRLLFFNIQDSCRSWRFEDSEIDTLLGSPPFAPLYNTFRLFVSFCPYLRVISP